MRTGRLKEFLEVVFEWPSSQLKITFDSHYEPLAGVVGFCPTTVVTGHYSQVMWSVLLPLLATLSAFLGAFDLSLGRHGPTTTSGHSCVA
jgi:hypothetical protein